MSLFSSPGKDKGTLFSSTETSRGASLFGTSKSVVTSAGGSSLFGVRQSITFASSASRPSMISVYPPAPTPSASRPNPLPSPQAWSRDTAVPVGRRRQSTAASQISRKYSRLQSTVGTTPRRTSDEAEASSEIATSDLRLCDVPRQLNTIERIRSIFSRFGVIERVIPNRSKCSTVIHFRHVENAKAARHHGNSLKGFESVIFFFHNRRSNKKLDLSSSGTFAPRSLKRPGLTARDSSPPTLKTPKVARLDGLMGIVAATAADRLNVLDQRDRLTRTAISGKTDALRIKAVCPDMCPERERYARQEQHRLSVFEMMPGSQQVDHNRAVKEYSRSSADQEMPLPHDLRPLPVLSRTMRYLLTEIADVCNDGNSRFGWGEWFDFLWDRTRAIRKEITQLRLCDVATAAIVEQTSRFHIFAAARLCELPVDEFDQKINDENLTKCLQTLKELYYDLSLKTGPNKSPNEAEFRSYMILRNLNDSSILNDVTQLEPEVRASPAVRLALEAYFAVSNNNYVRFFKLVRQASLLQACLLHRYFNQVRYQAIRVMVRAYTPPGSKISFPLSKLVTQLAFDTTEAAVDFCNRHNLVCKDDSVMFVRPTDTHPKQALICQRALTLVESKLNGYIGDVLNGGPLTRPFELHSVHSSFDSGKRFVGSSTDLLIRSLSNEAASRGEIAKEKKVELSPENMEDREEEEEEEVEEEEEEEDDYEEEEEEEEELSDGTDIVDEELEEGEIRDNEKNPVKNSRPQSVVQHADTSPVVSSSASSLTHLVLNDVVEQLLMDTVEEQSRSALSPLLHADLTARKAAMEAVTLSLVDEVTRELTATHALSVLRTAQSMARCRQEATEEVASSLLTSCLKVEVVGVAENFLTSAQTEGRLRSEAEQEVASSLLSHLLAQLSQEVVAEEVLLLYRKRKWLARWRAAVGRREMRRHALLLIAAGPPLEHSRVIAHRLLGARRATPSFQEVSQAVALPTPGARFMRAVRERSWTYLAPLSPDEFRLEAGQDCRLMLLLGRGRVSLELSGWLFAKLEQLAFIDPMVVDADNKETAYVSDKAGQVVGSIHVGCMPSARLRHMPALAVEEAESLIGSCPSALVVRLEQANKALWPRLLAAGLRRLLDQCRQNWEEDSKKATKQPPLTLCSFLDLFLHRCVFEPLSLLRTTRMKQRLGDLSAQHLLHFYSCVIAHLSSSHLFSSDVVYRFASLLELRDVSHALDHYHSWSGAKAKVEEFVRQQHLSERCRSECLLAVEDAAKAWCELARDYDLHRFIQPASVAFPWIGLAELWFNERAHEVLRHCNGDALLRQVLVQHDDSTRCVSAALAAGQAVLAAPLSQNTYIEEQFLVALEEARRRKEDTFRRRHGSGNVEKRAGQRWSKLQKEMDELRASMNAQLDDSLHLSCLFEENVDFV